MKLQYSCRYIKIEYTLEYSIQNDYKSIVGMFVRNYDVVRYCVGYFQMPFTCNHEHVISHSRKRNE